MSLGISAAGWAAIAATTVTVASSADSARKQANAAKDASRTQGEAADEATNLQRDIFDQQQANQQPWLDAGKSALGTLSTGLKPGGEFTKKFGMDDFTADPAYQWRLQQGQKAIQGTAAANGSLMSGRTLKALSDYGANQATQTYQDAYNRWNNDQTSLYNKYSALAGVGQQQVNALNSQAGQYASNVGNILTNTSNSIAGNQIGAANAQAAGQVAAGNAVTNGIGQWMNYNNYQNYMNSAYPTSTGGATGAYSFNQTQAPVDYSLGSGVKLGG